MKKEVFKPITIIAGIVLLTLIGFGLFQLSKKTDELQAMKMEKDNLTDVMYQRDSTINDFMMAFNEIDDNLTFINSRRNQLSIEAANEMDLDRKTTILKDIKLMDSMLVASSRHIEDLEKRLKDSGVKMRSFENRIAALNKTMLENSAEMDVLRQSLEEKEYQIAGLNTRLEMYEAVVEEKDEVIRVKEYTIEEKLEELNQLNKAWYTMGSFRELKEHGILSRSGGILGIGSTKEIQQNFSNDYFTPLDIRETKTIPIASKSARVISDHPDDSYDFIVEDGLITALVIENPEEFWKISKYVVVETK
jgi:hypothetical protein